MPMDQSEALWISFSLYPFAVKIAAGKIHAVSGAAWTAELQSEPRITSSSPASRGSMDSPSADF